jgi:hypothetical protein
MRGLTFELSGRRRQDAKPGLVKMYSVPPDRAWRPAVGAPLERGVRPHSGNAAARPRPKSCDFNSVSVAQGRIGEFFLSSGGFASRPSDQPPQPTSGSRGRLCSQAKQTSEIVPALPPITMQASPDRAMSKFRASPIPQGTTTVAGQSDAGISPGGTMLSTMPPAAIARSAATRVTGLPQPLTTVIPRLARSVPASPASSYAAEPGSALPSTQTWGRRMDVDIVCLVRPNVRAKLAPTVGRAGQVGENVQGTADLARVARRWGST